MEKKLDILWSVYFHAWDSAERETLLICDYCLTLTIGSNARMDHFCIEMVTIHWFVWMVWGITIYCINVFTLLDHQMMVRNLMFFDFDTSCDADINYVLHNKFEFFFQIKSRVVHRADVSLDERPPHNLLRLTHSHPRSVKRDWSFECGVPIKRTFFDFWKGGHKKVSLKAPSPPVIAWVCPTRAQQL